MRGNQAGILSKGSDIIYIKTFRKLIFFYEGHPAIVLKNQQTGFIILGNQLCLCFPDKKPAGRRPEYGYFILSIAK